MTTPAETGEDPVPQWDAVADGCERHHGQLQAHTGRLDERMVELADVRSGEVVVEMTAGLGAFSRAFAAHVSHGGQVLCTDASQRMVEAARRHTDEALPVTFRTLDAQARDLEDDSVDLVVCRMGLMLVPDGARAAAEARRVLRAGGRLVATTWGPLEHNPWITTFAAAMLAHDHAPPTGPHGPGRHLLPRHGREARGPAARRGLRRRDRGSDRSARTGSVVRELLAVALGDERVTAHATAGLDSAEIDAVEATCREFAASHRHADGTYEFPAWPLLALARP